MKNALLFGHGVCLNMGSPCSDKGERVRKKGGGKRRRLTGKFSAASFRRLREFCVTHDCPGECWGITLTIPGQILNWMWVKDYNHQLCVWCNYHDVPMIWRCEMQQRGQPHLHLVVYCSAEKCLLLMLEWQRLLMRSGKCLSVEVVDKNVKDFVWVNRMFVHGAHHAFYLDKLQGDFRSWRYLVAHQSKGKQAQQGWVGRQWGVINRYAMIEDVGLNFDFDDRTMFALRRWVKRLSRRRINNFGRHFLLVNPNTLRRMINYLQYDYFDAPF